MRPLIISLLTFLAAAAAAQTMPPVLCYHQVREWRPDDGLSSKVYITNPQRFRQQLQLLHDSGYHSILPDELLSHLHKGTSIPEKSVMFTFDDGTIGQYTEALPELERFGFKAVFFIMTVTLDKAGYLSREQVRRLAAGGHVIGCHTWDHHKVTTYGPEDWNIQLSAPTADLSKLTAIQVVYFAYPYGIWNAAAISRLQEAGYKAAFQLQGRTDAAHADYTLQRILVNGNWRAPDLLRAIEPAGK